MNRGRDEGPEDAGGAERRGEARVPIRVEVRFEEVSQAARALRAFTTNISSGGVCLLTQHSYPVGHRLALTLSVEGHTLQLQGVVAWVRGGAVGVRFVDVPDAEQALLRSITSVIQLEGARMKSKPG
jgi:uncharacterized protein (TIGR02266 family)